MLHRGLLFEGFPTYPNAMILETGCRHVTAGIYSEGCTSVVTIEVHAYPEESSRTMEFPLPWSRWHRLTPPRLTPLLTFYSIFTLIALVLIIVLYSLYIVLVFVRCRTWRTLTRGKPYTEESSRTMESSARWSRWHRLTPPSLTPLLTFYSIFTLLL